MCWIRRSGEFRGGALCASSHSHAAPRLGLALEALQPGVSQCSASTNFPPEVSVLPHIGAIGSWASDGILELLFQDDRVPVVINAVSEEFSAELGLLSHILSEGLAVLSGLGQLLPKFARAEAFGIALVFASYTLRCFLPMREPSFFLMGQGNEQSLGRRRWAWCCLQKLAARAHGPLHRDHPGHIAGCRGGRVEFHGRGAGARHMQPQHEARPGIPEGHADGASSPATPSRSGSI